MTIVERMEEPTFRNPALLIDNDAVHDRDLPGGAAKAEERHACPDPERLTERDAVPPDSGSRSYRTGPGPRPPPGAVAFTVGPLVPSPKPPRASSCGPRAAG